MRKLLFFICAVCALCACTQAFLNLDDSTLTRVESGKQCVQVTKPSSETTGEYVEALEKAAANAGSDILYESVHFEGDRQVTDLYVTVRDRDFLGLDVDAAAWNAFSSGSFTSLESAKGEVAVPALQQDLDLVPFAKLKDQSLDYANFYVADSAASDFVSALKRQGVSAEVLGSSGAQSGQSDASFFFAVLLALAAFFVMLFYLFSKDREIMVRKVEGYSSWGVFAHEWRVTGGPLVLIMLALAGAYCLVLIALRKGGAAEVAASVGAAGLAAAVLAAALFSVACLYLFVQSDVLSLKGKGKNRVTYIATVLFKGALAVLLVIACGSSLERAQELGNLQQAAQQVSAVADAYVTTPMNAQSSEMPEDVLTKRLGSFYKTAVEKYDAVLIDTSNYRYMQTPVDNEVIVNENYLRLNPLKTADGGDVLGYVGTSGKKLDVLVPEGRDVKAVAEEEADTYDLKKSQVNVVEYQEGSVVNSYSEKVNPASFGAIRNPKIVLYNVSLMKEELTRFFSGQYVLLKAPSSGDAYSTVVKDLKNDGLDQVIRETPFLSKSYSTQVNQVESELFTALAEAAASLAGFVVLIVFATRSYFLTGMRRLTVMRIEGYSPARAYRGYFLLQLLLALVAITASVFVDSIQWPLCVIALVLDLCMFTALARREQAKSIVKMLKRGEA